MLLPCFPCRVQEEKDEDEEPEEEESPEEEEQEEDQPDEDEAPAIPQVCFVFSYRRASSSLLSSPSTVEYLVRQQQYSERDEIRRRARVNSALGDARRSFCRTTRLGHDLTCVTCQGCRVFASCSFESPTKAANICSVA